MEVEHGHQEERVVVGDVDLAVPGQLLDIQQQRSHSLDQLGFSPVDVVDTEVLVNAGQAGPSRT